MVVAILLIILAGGMPWTDVFGSGLKWLQEKKDTGYPKNWRHTQGLYSVVQGNALTLDSVVEIARSKNLEGKISIKLPMKAEGVYSISNRSLWLRDQKVFHIDQYTGEVLKSHTWEDVGVLMNLRQVAMRLHQGEYGFTNWLAVLLIVFLFTLSTIAGI